MSVPIIYSWTESTRSSNGGNVSASWQDIGTIEVVPEVPVAAGASNATTGIAFNGTNLQAIELISTQNCTLYVNAPSGGSPFATINLKAGIPYTWSASKAQISNPLNTNVTQIYVTATSACIISGRILTT